MPSGVRETDSALIKKSLSDLNTKISAQNDEICALKLTISELTSLVKNFVEGSKNFKCDKCGSPPDDELANVASANGMELASTTPRGKETVQTQDGIKKKKIKSKSQTEKRVNRSKLASTPKKDDQDVASDNKTIVAAAPRPAAIGELALAPAQAAATSEPPADQENNGGWTVASRKRRNDKVQRNKRVVRCSGAPSDILCAADTTRYLHVWGAHPDTTEANVIAYLNTKTKSTVYSAVKMMSKRPTNYSSFKVGVPENLYEECISPQYWPKGFSADRWLFRLERSPRDAKSA